MSDKINQENFEVVRRWSERTKRVLLYELGKHKIGISKDLEKSLEEKVFTSGTDIISQLSFLTRGRFVDMGAGRRPKLEARSAKLGPYRSKFEGSRKGRKPKKWYTRALYGRLNDLQGVLGYKMMEQAIEAIKENIE